MRPEPGFDRFVWTSWQQLRPVREFDVDLEEFESQLEEFNKCHEPAGAPTGGRFCSAGPGDTARLKALKIPPAWTNVLLNEDPTAELQAVGTDVKGRRQYRYSAEHSQAAAAEKFSRLKEFDAALPALRARLAADLDNKRLAPAEREAAAALYLIDKTAFRVGSDAETGGDKKAYGATTLLASHAEVSGDTTRFSFTGKKGVQIDKSVTDARLARLVSPRLATGGRLFKTTDGAVRDYLHSRGGDFKVKDFRTWHGTATALREIAKMPVPKTSAALVKAQRQVVKTVARHLGNTPAVAKSSYIDPAVWSPWTAQLMRVTKPKKSSR